jgi:hypothetical protein
MSKNSINTIEDYKKAFDEGIIDKIAITDHDYIREAQNFQDYFGEDKIIIGQEISTTDGDMIGLFLKRFVPSGVSAERAAQHIKSQDGVVYVPHPFARKGIGKEVLENIKSYIDIVEIFNAWTFRSIKKPFTSTKLNEKALVWAKENDIPGFASSDCHYRSNIGRSYTEMEDFSSKSEFLHSLKGELKYTKRHSKIGLLSFRTWIKGMTGRDMLSFIK